MCIVDTVLLSPISPCTSILPIEPLSTVKRDRDGNIISMSLRSGTSTSAERKANKFEIPLVSCDREAIMRAGAAFEQKHGFQLQGDPREGPFVIYARALLRGQIPAEGPGNPAPRALLGAEDPLMPLLTQQLQYSCETSDLLLARNQDLSNELDRVLSTLDLEVCDNL
jgi:hypothetical protein